MATAKEKNDISELQKNFAVMQNDLSYIKSGQDDLKLQISRMVFVPVSEFQELKKRVIDLEAYNVSNKVGTVFANLFASKAFTFVIGLIFAAIIYYVVATGAK